MKAFFFTFLCFWMIPSSLFALEENEYILRYDLCENILESRYYADIANMSSKKCVLLQKEKSDTFILLSSEDIFLNTTRITPELANLLKKKYYRGEKLLVSIEAEIVPLSNQHLTLSGDTASLKHLTTLKENYHIKILEDSIIRNYPLLSKACQAESFILQCHDDFHKKIQEKIDTIFSNIFLKGEELFSQDRELLLQEKVKIQKIQALFYDLQKEYKNSQRILYLLESIDYKLQIYLSLIENTLDSKKKASEISQHNETMKGEYFLHLGQDIFLYSGDLYVYFYYKNTLVNTLQNDLSHFSTQERDDLRLTLDDRGKITQELIKKYSLGSIKNTGMQEWRLLYKNWFQGPTSILVKEGGYRYSISGYASDFTQSGKFIFFIAQDIHKNNTYVGKLSGKTQVEEFYRSSTSQSKILGYRISGNNILIQVSEISGKTYELSFPLGE